MGVPSRLPAQGRSRHAEVSQKMRGLLRESQSRTLKQQEALRPLSARPEAGLPHPPIPDSGGLS